MVIILCSTIFIGKKYNELVAPREQVYNMLQIVCQ